MSRLAPSPRLASLLISSCAVAAAACGGRDPGPPVEATVGDFAVRVVPAEGRVEVRTADGELVLDTGPDAFALGTGEEWIEHRFGMFKIEEGARSLRTAATFGKVEIGAGGAIAFDLYDAGDRAFAGGRISAEGDGELMIRVQSADADDDRATVSFGCEAGEHFLGLGGQSFDVDHRGQRVPLWVSEDGITKQDSDELPGIWALVGRRHTTHTPIPAFVSSRGFAAMLDTSSYAVFDLCAADEARVTLEAWEPGVTLRVFAGPARTAPQAIERLTARTGRARVPPPFAFAPWLDAIFGSANVRRVAEKLRAEDVPASVIWTEDWRGGQDTSTGYALDEDWGVDRELYPDFEALAGDLHGKGFKLLTYHNSFIVKTGDVHDAAAAAGHTIHDGAGAPYYFTGPTFEDTTLLDLSSAAARAWAKQQIAAGFALGADGHMADFAEWLPTDAVLSTGPATLADHNRYPVEWLRLQREVIDAQTDGVERLTFARAAHLGAQPLVDVLWAGDQQTDFSAGDGLPSVIPMGLGLGVVGFPIFAHDVGGYMSQLTVPATRELWFRWVTLGALAPVMRTHHGRSARDNWSWESDAASIAHLARWARFHQRLFPYLLAAAHAASATGMPIMRPLALAHPDFAPGWTATDQYMLGDTLYVAPVVAEGATGRTLALPAGRYHPIVVADGGRDVHGGSPVIVAGNGAPIAVQAPLAEVPLFVRDGALLVLLPPEVDTVVAASDPSLVTLADIADDRELLAWGGGDASFTEAGGLAYEWHGAALTAAPRNATWNGAAIAPTAGRYLVTGPGTLSLDDGAASLTVTGGAATRALAIRIAP